MHCPAPRLDQAALPPLLCPRPPPQTLRCVCPVGKAELAAAAAEAKAACTPLSKCIEAEAAAAKEAAAPAEAAPTATLAHPLLKHFLGAAPTATEEPAAATAAATATADAASP